jgi:hypothetical protein
LAELAFVGVASARGEKGSQARGFVLVQHKRLVQHGSDCLAREVVVGRSQPADCDDAVGAF